jgi:hypothetical protein
MSRRTLYAVVAVACAIAIWIATRSHDEPRSAGGAVLAGSAVPPPPDPPPTQPVLPHKLAPRGTVEIRGTVIDRADGSPVGGVEVVVRGTAGEASVASSADGRFALEVSPGAYRAFVRGDDVMTVGLADPVRLDLGPRVELAGLPDESLMPLIVALKDTVVELPVVHGGVIDGEVVDDAGAPVAHAVVRARTNMSRPALGTDSAETDDHGTFTLRVPPGAYSLEASHRAYAGVRDPVMLDIQPGTHLAATLHMGIGCIVSGHVVRSDGKPANEGALEKLNPRGQFGPAGTVNTDGTFRWATLDAGEVTLRAWPWMSMPSSGRTIACAEGVHVDDVTFKIPDGVPSLDGTIVDVSGAPVPFAYLDVQPLDNQTVGQQERADASGRWHVYDMPLGRYAVTATAPGQGIVTQTVVAPRTELHLQLGGTGRIEGTTTDLGTGSFEAWFDACQVAPDNRVPIAHEPRIVQVRGGRFTIDDAPACALGLDIRWRGITEHKSVIVDVMSPTHLELDLGTPRSKTVHGVVRDDRGKPIRDAQITATSTATHATANARTDGNGRFAIDTFSGAQIVAGDGERLASVDIGHANVAGELVELTLRKPWTNAPKQPARAHCLWRSSKARSRSAIRTRSRTIPLSNAIVRCRRS